MRRTTYLNGVLTVIAALLALLVVDRVGEGPVGTMAMAGPPTGEPDPKGGLVSAADQRKQIILELRALGKRLEQVEAQLKGGLSVKVTEMPELRLPAGD